MAYNNSIGARRTVKADSYKEVGQILILGGKLFYGGGGQCFFVCQNDVASVGSASNSKLIED